MLAADEQTYRPRWRDDHGPLMDAGETPAPLTANRPHRSGLDGLLPDEGETPAPLTANRSVPEGP